MFSKFKRWFSPKKPNYIKDMSDAHLYNCFLKFRDLRYFNEMLIRLNNSNNHEISKLFAEVSKMFEEKITRSIVDDFEVVK